MKQRTLDWRNRRSWLGSIRFYAGELLDPAMRRHLERKRPQCWSDDLSWLPNHEELVPVFCELLASYYSYVKAFHGCRPENTRSYYEHGLQGHQPDRIQSRFRELFHDVDPNQLQKAIDELGRRSTREKGKIWLTGDDRKMLDDFGHYSINGSEYLMSLAARLTRFDRYGEDYRWRLREIGVPTVLEVDIPFALIRPRQRTELANLILSAWGQNVTGKHLGMDSPPCYVIHEDIPAGCIKDHYHPERIRDIHREPGMYVSNITRCEMCA
ncbi:hypothetical protein [Stutzerimonas nitrititolerans]|uniref:hypothetical protein n=1 Tax=Stutzerimonas nitrititolerans TaxID=2482751 RepID=UPI001BDCC9AF|nr:hypothetical protein [Stutzerimonas nitrititolerans]MBT1119028.1 hypothetical protein [Stutzerimonas nitrititolerans]